MGYVSAGMGDCFSALLASLMALWLVLVDRNPFQPRSYMSFGKFLILLHDQPCYLYETPISIPYLEVQDTVAQSLSLFHPPLSIIEFINHTYISAISSLSAIRPLLSKTLIRTSLSLKSLRNHLKNHMFKSSFFT